MQRPVSPITVNGNSTPLNAEKELLERLKGKGLYSRYAGGLLLNPFLARMLEGMLPQERALQSASRFTLESFLLMLMQMNQFEVNNYESASEVHPDELGPLLGVDRSPSLSALYEMTPELLDLADPMTFASRMAANYLKYLSTGSRLFYVDGHFQRYFGRQAFLKDYHPQTRRSQKGYTQYALSTHQGAPLLLLDSDSLITFTDSIAVLMRQLLQLLPEGLAPWVVFDQGGYEKALFARFAGREASPDQFHAHYLCWDPYDLTDYSTMALDWEEFILEFQGNDPQHPKETPMKIAEAPAHIKNGIWDPRSPAKHQRKLVLAVESKQGRHGKFLCSPFATSDRDSSAIELAAALTSRWRQENGFKMGDGDYGLGCISTYRTKSYTPEIFKDLPPELQSEIPQRTFKNPDLNPIDEQREKTRAVLGRVTERLERLQQGETLRADRSKQRLPQDETGLKEKRQELLQELDSLDVQRAHIPLHLNKWDYLAQRGCVRLDFKKKWMLDILRASAHNVRRMALDTWMNVYTNWRDHTQRFRDLLNTGGHLRLRSKTLQVELKPLPQPRYQEAAEAFVERLTKLVPTTFGIGPFKINFSFKN